MDKIQHLITKGEAYYGHGEVRCFSCRNGAILTEVEGNNFDNDALTQSQVDFLLEVAAEHKRLAGFQNHRVKVYEWQRGDGESVDSEG